MAKIKDSVTAQDIASGFNNPLETQYQNEQFAAQGFLLPADIASEFQRDQIEGANPTMRLIENSMRKEYQKNAADRNEKMLSVEELNYKYPQQTAWDKPEFKSVAEYVSERNNTKNAENTLSAMPSEMSGIRSLWNQIAIGSSDPINASVLVAGVLTGGIGAGAATGMARFGTGLAVNAGVDLGAGLVTEGIKKNVEEDFQNEYSYAQGAVDIGSQILMGATLFSAASALGHGITKGMDMYHDSRTINNLGKHLEKAETLESAMARANIEVQQNAALLSSVGESNARMAARSINGTDQMIRNHLDSRLFDGDRFTVTKEITTKFDTAGLSNLSRIYSDATNEFSVYNSLSGAKKTYSDLGEAIYNAKLNDEDYIVLSKTQEFFDGKVSRDIVVDSGMNAEPKVSKSTLDVDMKTSPRFDIESTSIFPRINEFLTGSKKVDVSTLEGAVKIADVEKEFDKLNKLLDSSNRVNVELENQAIKIDEPFDMIGPTKVEKGFGSNIEFRGYRDVPTRMEELLKETQSDIITRQVKIEKVTENISKEFNSTVLVDKTQYLKAKAKGDIVDSSEGKVKVRGIEIESPEAVEKVVKDDLELERLIDGCLRS